MFKEKVTQTVPRFIMEGYALYKGEEFYKADGDGVEIALGNKKGLNLIQLKTDAPLWAQDEFKEWKKAHN